MARPSGLTAFIRKLYERVLPAHAQVENTLKHNVTSKDPCKKANLVINTTSSISYQGVCSVLQGG